MKRNKLMNELKSRFGLNAVPSEEFGASYRGGIWIRGSVSNEQTDWYNADDTMYPERPFNQYLKQKKWYAEPYDSETIMLWQL